MRSCLAMVLCAAAYGQNATVRVWNDSLQLPTYIEGDPDPAPEFQAFTTGIANYPYPVRRNFTQEKRVQTWRTLNLENEFLLCRILPELGGHLYNCTDKRSGREIFYVNPVVKPADVGRRGSWVAMGIESSFPIAHSRATTSPVDAGIQSDPDGSGRAVVEDIDRVTGMEWRVEYVLRPGRTVIEQRVMLYNPGITRRSYEWWSNAEVAFDDPGLRFVVPTNMMASHGATEIVAWPNVTPGKDESLVTGHKDAYAWFAYGTREPFFAAYKPATRSGVGHFADPRVVAGKKLWIWGSDQDAYVRKELTDNAPS